MTREDILEATHEALSAAEAQAAHFGRMRKRLSLENIGSRPAPGDLELEQCHAFLHMFEQLFDVIARRLFRGAIALVDEDPASLSAKEITLRLEQLRAIPGRDEWLAVGEARNAVVHDYPLSVGALLAHVARAEAAADLLLTALSQVGDFLRHQGRPHDRSAR